MSTTNPLYLVTSSLSYRGVPLGNFSEPFFGETGSEALTKFHRKMQHSIGYAPHEYRVIRFSEIDPVRRHVIAHLPFPQGPNPCLSAPYNTKISDPTAKPQTEFAF